MSKRRRKGASTMAAAGQDHGSPLLRQHATVVVDQTMAAGVARARVKHECRLDWYLDRCLIVDRQHEAGMRFRADWLLSAEATRMTGSYGDRIPGGGGFTDARLAARKRIDDALKAVGAAGLKAVLVDVCGQDEWASSRLPILRIALDWLADHYRLPKEA